MAVNDKRIPVYEPGPKITNPHAMGPRILQMVEFVLEAPQLALATEKAEHYSQIQRPVESIEWLHQRQ